MYSENAIPTFSVSVYLIDNIAKLYNNDEFKLWLFG